MNDLAIALTNWPDKTLADSFAAELVMAELAACVNVLPAMNSIYRWQGKVERATEVQMLIKTRRPCLAQIETRLHQCHPYETPEWLVLHVDAASDTYLNWINENAHA